MDEYKNLTIKTWAVEDRPREKYLLKGLSSLTNAELIAILIGSGNRNESAVELAKKILQKVQNNLNLLGKLSLEDFIENKGIGKAKAITIIAALELGRRRNSTAIMERKVIKTSRDAFDLLHSQLSDLPYEEFWVLLLNRANRVIDQIKISKGGISGTVTDVKVILKNAIEKLASSLIVCHNHPSGNLLPSRNDTEFTAKLREDANMMDIKLLDHLIIADGKYYSFADEGLI